MKHSGIEWIGEIPKEWILRRAKSIFAQRNSKGNEPAVLLSATQKQGMMPQSLLEGVVQVNNNTDLQTFKTVHINDFVISLRSFQGGFEKSNYEGVCSPAYQVFYNIAPIDHNYYWLLFKSYGFVDKINSLTVGIREGKNIQYKDFANMILAVPPLSEQQKIANYLDKVCGEVDEIIALQEQMIEELKAYKQSVITEAVTKGLNPNTPMKDSASREQNHACMNYAEAQPVFERKFKDSGIDWIGEIPEEWEVCKISRRYHIKLGKMLQPNQLTDTDTYEFYFCAANVGQNSIKYEPLKQMWFSDKEKEIYELRKGDMLVVEGGDVASCDIIYKDVTNIYYQNALHRVRPILNDDIRLLRFFLMSAKAVGFIGLLCNKATISHFTKEKFESILMPFPPLEEQQSIASYLDTKCAEIDALIAIKQAKIEELKDYKKSVIYEYVTGKKEVV